MYCSRSGMVWFIFVLITSCLIQEGAAIAGEAFPFKSSEIVKSAVDSKNGTGYAILSKGRILYFKRWITQDASALEATFIDSNYFEDKQRDWFDDRYLEGKILWLSKLVLNKTDNQTVIKAFRDKKYLKEVQKNGDIIYKIPGTNYSEFYFAVRQPGDFIDNASVKLRYVMTL